MARAGLDRNLVIRKAGEIADSEGLEALTLARLAHELGVKTPSLYNHVESLSALRRDLALEGVRQANLAMSRAGVGKSGTDALIAIGLAYREFAKSHAGLHAASLAAPQPDDAELIAASTTLLETVGAVLSAFNLRGADNYHAIRGLRAIIHGFVSLELAGAFGMPLEIDESLIRVLRNFGEGLSRSAELEAAV